MSTDTKGGAPVDAHSGTVTTGHEWDGIRELNTPLPRWWLYTFYACIVWAIGYWVVYPAWPLLSGYTRGVAGWQSRNAIVEDIAALKALRAPMNDKIAKASLTEIEKTPELLSFARAQGGAAFAINCAPCHGSGGQGAYGYPNLNADRWIWGGTLEEIKTTITHGARSADDSATHQSAMPAFGRDGLLDAKQMSNVADFVRTLSGGKADAGADLAAGKKLFADNCSACHGPEGKGNKDVGAPNLTTSVWLYGPTKADIVKRVTVGGGGVMPAWGAKLDEGTIKSLTVFVHSLGGGQ
jgi:cytochrome c oxidase cbb3-type subunit 3